MIEDVIVYCNDAMISCDINRKKRVYALAHKKLKLTTMNS